MSTFSQFTGGGGIKSIQRGVITITGGPGVNTVTATISAVNTAKSELRVLGSLWGSPDPTAAVAPTAYANLTNSTTITATRRNDSPTSQTHYVSWELTEWN